MAPPLSILDLGLLAGCGLVAGAVNAIAGGGSLIVFPALLAVGFAPLPANVTNSLAQWPGYLGSTVGLREELAPQCRRLASTTVAAAAGSATGSVLLLVLPGGVFDSVVPVLVLLASGLLALQPRLRRWIGEPEPGAPDNRRALLPVVSLAAVYGGYFGGALGVILIAVLALFAHDSLVRLNGLKVALSLVAATVTVVIFGLRAPVDWAAVAVVAPTTLVGGYAGARVARRLREAPLRWSVVVLGVGVAVYLALAP